MTVTLDATDREVHPAADEAEVEAETDTLDDRIIFFRLNLLAKPSSTTLRLLSFSLCLSPVAHSKLFQIPIEMKHKSNKSENTTQTSRYFG